MFEALSKHCFWHLLHCLGLLCRAGVYPSNLDYAALRAMTGRDGEGAVMLFVIFTQLLKRCGTLRNFVSFPKALPLAVVSSFPKALPLG